MEWYHEDNGFGKGEHKVHPELLLRQGIPRVINLISFFSHAKDKAKSKIFYYCRNKNQKQDSHPYMK